MFIDVFVQAFITRLVPIFSEVALTAIRHFQHAQYPVYAAVAAVGALLGSALLYMFGQWLGKRMERTNTPEKEARIMRLRTAAMGWMPWLLVLSPTPVGAVVLIAAGFFRMRAAGVAYAVVAAEIVWRILPYVIVS